MTEIQKLVELLRYAKQNMKSKEFSSQLEREFFIAETLLANGVIVPPCKVGDRVFIIEKEYRLNKVEHKIITCEIEFIYVSSKTKRYHTKKLECPYMDNGFNFRPKDIGKTVFLTKEEAEEKLKELGE